MKRKGGLLLFIASCIPGCGQMYQGYMKRGVSLLGMACLVIALASILNLGELAIFLPLLWLFAFFDAYNIHGQTEEQAAENPDRYLYGLSAMDSRKIAALCRGRHSLIGWVLVAMGVYALYSMVVNRLTNFLPEHLWWLRELLYYDMPRVLTAIVILALGVWFIRGPKSQQEEQDFTDFTPPAAVDSAPDMAESPMAENPAEKTDACEDGDFREDSHAEG